MSKHLDTWIKEHGALIDAAGELLLTSGLSNMVARRMHAHLLVLKAGLLYDSLHEPRLDMSPQQPVHDLTTRSLEHVRR